jgi:hypothetical protein
MDRKACLRLLRVHFITEGYLYDWLLALVLIIINFTVPTVLLPPVERAYSPDDASLAYPIAHVPLTEDQKYALVFVLPAAIAAVAQLWCRNWLDWWVLPTAAALGWTGRQQ